MTDKNDQESPFQVADKRHFNTDGTARQDAPQEESKNDTPDVNDSKKTQSSENSADSTPLPDFEINFTTFILSLASSVQISLGLVPNPLTHQTEINLPSARQTIDIFELLEEKTKGNLNKDEDRLLKQILYELRMLYVEAKKKRN